MLYILSGQDDFSLACSLDEIKKSIDDPGTLTVNTTTLDSQQVTLDTLRNVCASVPFLGGKRLVIINGLLERFQTREKSGSRKTNDNHKDESKSFGDCLTNLPESTVLVLIEGEIKSNNALFKELSGKAVVKYFPLLKGLKLRQWVQEHVTEAGGSISSQAVELLMKLVGSDLWTMSGEINKLITFTSGRRIEEADVRQIVSNSQQASIFAMIDAIIDFKANIAEQLLEQLLREGTAPAQVLFMLTRQVRLIVLARELKNQGKSEKDIQNKLGIANDFVLRKTLDQAARYSIPRLRDVYHHLLDTDVSIKTGKYDGNLALNILVAELCSQKVAQ